MDNKEIDEWFNKLSLTDKFKYICHHYITDEEYNDATIEEMVFEAFGIYNLTESFINNKWKHFSLLEKIEIFNEFFNL